MQLEWDGKVGPATIVGVVGSLSVLVTIGIMWGQQTERTNAAVQAAAEAKAAVVTQAQESAKRDKVVAQHSVSLGEIRTTLSYISPALQRIETKLDTAPKP